MNLFLKSSINGKDIEFDLDSTRIKITDSIFTTAPQLSMTLFDPTGIIVQEFAIENGSDFIFTISDTDTFENTIEGHWYVNSCELKEKISISNEFQFAGTILIHFISAIEYHAEYKTGGYKDTPHAIFESLLKDTNITSANISQTYNGRINFYEMGEKLPAIIERLRIRSYSADESQFFAFLDCGSNFYLRSLDELMNSPANPLELRADIISAMNMLPFTQAYSNQTGIANMTIFSPTLEVSSNEQESDISNIKYIESDELPALELTAFAINKNSIKLKNKKRAIIKTHFNPSIRAGTLIDIATTAPSPIDGNLEKPKKIEGKWLVESSTHEYSPNTRQAITQAIISKP